MKERTAKRALIFEPHASGHRLNYVRLFATAAMRRGLAVSVALGPGVKRTPEFEGHLSCVADNLQFLTTNGSSLGSKLRWLRNQIRTNLYSEVLIPYADGGVAEYFALVDLFSLKKMSGYSNISILKMRGTFAYHQSGLKRRLLNFLSLRLLASPTFKKLYLIDSLAHDFVQHRWPQLAKKTLFLPDPVCPGEQLSQRDASVALKLKLNCKYIGLIGVIDERKGADKLIDAFAASNISKEWSLLLVGKFSELIRKKLRSFDDDGRIIAIDRFVDNSELQTYFEACHFICAPFRQHIGSSSTVIRAAAANRPVLADSFGWISEMTNRYKLGRTCDTTDSAVLVSELQRFTHESQRWSASEIQQRFVAMHSEHNFLQLLSDSLAIAHA